METIAPALPIYEKAYHKKIELEESQQATRVAEYIRERFLRRRDTERFRATDFGCSTGIYVRELQKLGIEAIGIENSPAALENAVCNGIKEGDVTGACYDVWFSEISLCIEVAEHIDPEKSDDLIRCLLRHTKKWLIFSAAVPGQGGLGHINLRDQSYWIDSFEKRGWVVDHIETHRFLNYMCQGMHMGWLINNGIILRPIRRA